MERIFQHHVSVTACIGSCSLALNAGYAIGFSSPAVQDLESGVGQLQLNAEQASWFGSLLPLTAMFGSLLGGPIMDHLGRRTTLISVAVCFLVSWMTMFFSTDLPMLYAGRGFLGLATGMCTAVTPVYISEISPAFLRGSTGTVFSVLLALGIPSGYMAGVTYDWRGMTEIGAVIACFTFLICVLLPESPYWLLRRNRALRAEEVLRRLRGPDTDIAAEIKEIQHLQNELHTRVTVSEILRPSFIRPLSIGLALMVLQQFSGVNAIFFYCHEIFQRANFHNESLAGILVGMVQVVAMMFATFMMDHAGRRKLLLFSGLGMMMCHIMLGACVHTMAVTASGAPDNTALTSSPFLNSESFTNLSNDDWARSTEWNATLGYRELNREISYPVKKTPDSNATLAKKDVDSDNTQQPVAAWISLVLVVLYVIFYAIGFGPVPYISLSEMLPQRGRGVAGGLVTMSNWLCAFSLTKTFIGMVEAISPAGVFWLFAAVCALAIVFVWNCVPETKGKSLAEIQDIFTVRDKTKGHQWPPVRHPERMIIRTPIKIVNQMAMGSPILRSANRSPSVLEQTESLIA